MIHGILEVPEYWEDMIQTIWKTLGPIKPKEKVKIHLDTWMENGEKLVRFLLDSWISEIPGKYWRSDLYQLTKSQGIHSYTDVEEYKLRVLSKEEFLRSLTGPEVYQNRVDIDKLFESSEYKLLHSLSGLKAVHIW